jgi:hypothetical protein
MPTMRSATISREVLMTRNGVRAADKSLFPGNNPKCTGDNQWCTRAKDFGARDK